jgi:hypothetical protein
MRDFFLAAVPNAAASLWIGALVAFLLFGDNTSLRSRQNIALAAVLSLAPALLNVMDLSQSTRYGPWILTLIFLLTAGAAVWGFQLSRGNAVPGWRVNLRLNSLRALLAFIVAMDLVIVLGRPPDDAGIYTNLGARRWVETGTIPYADPKLKGPDAPAYGAAATYGPLLYISHMPVQWALRVHNNPPELAPKDSTYRRPTNFATKITCLIYFLLGLGALFVIVRRLAGEEVALAATALFAGSPYVLGLGGTPFFIGGLGYISHVAPTAAVLLAMATLDRPAVSGILLACAAGLLFWPAFLFPLWFAWRAWRREGTLAFTVGFALTGLVIGAIVVYFTHDTAIASVRLFLESTLEHQEGLGRLQYGNSTISFWNTHPGLAAVLHRPVFGTSSLFKPTFFGFAALCIAAAFWARGRSVPQFAALTAMLASGIQLWKTHATGSYVEWYLPFLIIALVGQTLPVPTPASSQQPATS